MTRRAMTAPEIMSAGDLFKQVSYAYRDHAVALIERRDQAIIAKAKQEERERCLAEIELVEPECCGNVTGFEQECCGNFEARHRTFPEIMAAIRNQP